MKEALFYTKENNNVVCQACYRKCIISNNNVGFCGVRKNINNKLFSLVYNKPIAINIDPIEKKPIYMFLEKTNTLSLGTVGCNFDCSFCQNYNISKVDKENILFSEEVKPEEIITIAKKNNCPSISYTYTEPTVFVEYALDIMKLAKENNLKNVWVSNGYMTRQVIDKISVYLDAINIDLKGDADFYKKLVNNVDIKNIQKNIRLFYEKNIHVEITNLLIEGYNTKQEQIQELVEFIASTSKDIPLHFTKAFPCYRLMDIVPTRKSTLSKAKEIAKKKGLTNVFLGNI